MCRSSLRVDAQTAPFGRGTPKPGKVRCSRAAMRGDHVSEHRAPPEGWSRTGRMPPSLARQCDPRGRRIGLTPEVRGCACLNHRLTSVVKASSPLASVFESFRWVLSFVTRATTNIEGHPHSPLAKAQRTPLPKGAVGASIRGLLRYMGGPIVPRVRLMTPPRAVERARWTQRNRGSSMPR